MIIAKTIKTIRATLFIASVIVFSNVSAQDSSSNNLYKVNIEKALLDSNVNSYFKQVYYKNQIISGDDSVMLSITDSLFSSESQYHAFYFMVFTRSMNGADGFYSEALGFAAMEFLETHTLEFVNYFNSLALLDSSDLRNWANCVYGEIQLSSEENELEAISNLKKTLSMNISENLEAQRGLITQLIEMLLIINSEG
ncbi:hypothetical protein GYB29_13170 [bacterium]|nr:hypothetical protein [bacterium]